MASFPAFGRLLDELKVRIITLAFDDAKATSGNKIFITLAPNSASVSPSLWGMFLVNKFLHTELRRLSEGNLIFPLKSGSGAVSGTTWCTSIP